MRMEAPAYLLKTLRISSLSHVRNSIEICCWLALLFHSAQDDAWRGRGLFGLCRTRTPLAQACLPQLEGKLRISLPACFLSRGRIRRLLPTSLARKGLDSGCKGVGSQDYCCAAGEFQGHATATSTSVSFAESEVVIGALLQHRRRLTERRVANPDIHSSPPQPTLSSSGVPTVSRATPPNTKLLVCSLFAEAAPAGYCRRRYSSATRSWVPHMAASPAHRPFSDDGFAAMGGLLQPGLQYRRPGPGQAGTSLIAQVAALRRQLHDAAKVSIRYHRACSTSQGRTCRCGRPHGWHAVLQSALEDNDVVGHQRVISGSTPTVASTSSGDGSIMTPWSARSAPG